MAWSLQSGVFAFRRKGEAASLGAFGRSRCSIFGSFERVAIGFGQFFGQVHQENFRDRFTFRSGDLSLKGQGAFLPSSVRAPVAVGADPAFFARFLDLIRAGARGGRRAGNQDSEPSAILIAGVIFFDPDRLAWDRDANIAL